MATNDISSIIDFDIFEEAELFALAEKIKSEGDPDMVAFICAKKIVENAFFVRKP